MILKSVVPTISILTGYWYGIKKNSPNKKIEEAKEHHLDEDALDTT